MKTFCGLCLPNSLGYVRSERFPCPPFSPALPVDAKAKMSFNGVNSKPKCPPQCSFIAMKWLYNVRRVEWCFFFLLLSYFKEQFISFLQLTSKCIRHRCKGLPSVFPCLCHSNFCKQLWNKCKNVYSVVWKPTTTAWLVVRTAGLHFPQAPDSPTVRVGDRVYL